MSRQIHILKYKIRYYSKCEYRKKMHTGCTVGNDINKISKPFWKWKWQTGRQQGRKLISARYVAFQLAVCPLLVFSHLVPNLLSRESGPGKFLSCIAPLIKTNDCTRNQHFNLARHSQPNQSRSSSLSFSLCRSDQ